MKTFQLNEISKNEMKQISGRGLDEVGLFVFRIIQQSEPIKPSQGPLSADDETVGTLP